MKLVLFGAPGVGKGTQAEILSKHYNIPHISTGDMLRSEIARETPLGKTASDLISKGQLVPDDVIIGMVKSRLACDDCKNGFLLDGFPRTVSQADALANIVDVDAVIDIDVPYDMLVERICGRRLCSQCGEIFHVSVYASDKCNKCGAALKTRKDDTPEVVAQRIEVYHQSSEPLVEYYNGKGKLLKVDGVGAVDAVSKEIITALGKINVRH